ncbi:MAG: bifunctional folylpolyglutamate synthase/dihydrofolate synthase [Phycisphaerales bacterium JB043]
MLDRTDIERTRVRRISRDEFKLDRIKALLRALDNPQDSLRIVHVAGTKGKGSTCAMVASCLEACEYTVGLYTSPHLVDLRERITINGHMIPYNAFTDIMQRVTKAEAQIEKRHGIPTFFEMMTAIAMLWFAEQAVDLVVLECGLGGRLDATNVVNSEVTAVTSISRDHMQFLGETVEEIAREKGGIFKPGANALTIEQPEEILDALRECAQDADNQLEVLGTDIEFSYRFEASAKLGPHTCICLTSERSSFEHIDVPLPGEHQAMNCGLALAIVDKLRARGFETPESKVIAGLEKVTEKLPGRMEMVRERPRVLIDGAHNPESIQALVRSIGAHIPYDSMVMIFGCAEDKDVDALLDQVALGADKVIFTRARANSRAVDPEDLQQWFSERSGKMSQWAPNFAEALDIAQRAVARDDLICVTGSFYLVGEARKHFDLLAQREAREAAIASA